MGRQPQVISGMRNPRSERLEKIVKDTEESLKPPTDVPEGPNETVYVSSIRRYRVLLAAEPGTTDPFTGQKAGGRVDWAVFDEGVYRNKERDPKKHKAINAKLQSNSRFGKFGQAGTDFWLASEQKASMESRRLKQAAETLRSLPKEVLDDFLAKALKPGDAVDHELPTQ